jgi:t-SNARE complex subunit (syntaxin)
MNNRLGEVMPSWAMEEDIEVGNNNTTNDFDDFDDDDESPSNQNQTISNEKKIMDQFYNDIDKLKSQIETITQATTRIKQMDDESMRSTSDAKDNALSTELNSLIANTNRLAKEIKNMLEVLKNETQVFKSDNSVTAGDLRVRENLCNTLTRKFIDEMKLYQEAQQKYKVNAKEKLERKIRVAAPDATDEEVDTIMRSDGGAENLIQSTFLVGGVNDSIKQTYRKVAAKYQDVLALEQSMAELHQMFLDMALLVEQQGELLDNIEYNVKSAADYVEEGNIDVYRAIEHQKSARKKQCWIIILVIVLVIILLFSLRVLP